MIPTIPILCVLLNDMKINIHGRKSNNGEHQPLRQSNGGNPPAEAKAQFAERKTFARATPHSGEVWVKAWCAAYNVNRRPEEATAAADAAVADYRERYVAALSS